ncbi:MAG: hypothetical protein GTN76_11210 [Candidatus Aenigmarchaeota archaeon]|nr:hypothetical protein [Candidatus Aenigmarchaeota archaeon]NIQ17997.1 hypothetical protein [Candidatus Aenigmarchaeota archaeon]
MAEKKTVKKKAVKKKEKEPTWDEIGELVGKKIEKASKEGKFDCKSWTKEKIQCSGTGGCIYFLGFIASLIYYVTTAPDLWGAVVGFFKAIFWPAFLVYGLLLFIGA